MKSIFLVILLTGCSTVVKKEIVNIPVPVFCQTLVPEKPVLKYAPGTYVQVFPVVRDLKGDREKMIAYQNRLEAALISCKD